jgi:amidase
LVNPTGIHSLAQLINFTHAEPREDWPDRNTVTWEAALALNLTQTSPNYTRSLFSDLELGSNGTIAGAINIYGLDALIMPTSMAAGVAAIAGYPVVTVPLGFYPANTTAVLNSRGTLLTSGPHFPFGLSFLGLRFSEEKLISYAYAFEQATMVHPPRFSDEGS